MENHLKEELADALEVVTSTIRNCEKIQPKFAEGTAQHTLLNNRIKALYITKALITSDINISKYAKEELIQALAPVSSIISKCEKAQRKHAEGTAHHTRFHNIIKAMYLSKSLISNEISKRG